MDRRAKAPRPHRAGRGATLSRQWSGAVYRGRIPTSEIEMESGKVLGERFELGEEVAKGGGGAIFRAIDRVNGTAVAVKILHALGHREMSRFEREIRTLSRLSHPGLVAYVGHGDHEDRPYLVTEWLDGEDLRARLARKELSLWGTVTLAERVAATLAYLHGEGVVHRDLKPSNIFLVGARPDQAKIIDLGLVTANDDSVSLTATGMVVGTPGYMAPEQARGERDLGPRSDVFALGCVMYRCLSGKPAFGGANVMELMTSLLLHEPPALARARPDLPYELTDLVHRMLQKDPGRRPASGREVAGELSAIDLGEAAAKDSRTGPSKARTLTGEERRYDVTLLDRDVMHLGEERLLLGKATPFVGRDWELDTILGIVQSAVDGPSARAVLVTGPPGAGKTRLAREVQRAVRDAHPAAKIWQATCVTRAAGSPFSAMASLVRSALDLEDDPGGPGAAERLVGAVSRRLQNDEAALLAAEVLADGIGVPFAAPSPSLREARQSPRLFAERLRTTWQRLLAAETAERPVVMFLEDLHWGDGSTIRLLGDLLGALPDRPWLVIGLGRPEIDESHPRLWQERDCQHLRLRPLHRRPAERIVRCALGDDAPAEVVERIVAQADGNPFFLEELCRAQAANGGGEAEGAVPETVLAIVHRRLSLLDAGARRFLRAASVLGDVFWVSAAAELLGPTSAGLVGLWVEVLVAQEIVVRRARSRFPGETELAFRHALIREGAYAMLTEQDRALGHRLAGEWLRDKGEVDPLVLAKHFDEGGARDVAVTLYLEAAARALSATAFETATALASRGLELAPRAIGAAADLGDADAHGVPSVRTAALHRVVAEAALARGDRPRAVAEILRAEALVDEIAARIPDDEVRARYLALPETARILQLSASLATQS
ncbi:MAG: protein kinase [Polyangiaceae bacterium]